MRPTFVDVDLGAVRHNTSAIRQLIAPAELCAVVKADAYGHGDAPVADAALEAGATWLAVALVEEGIRLREAGITAPILVLSEPDTGAAADVAAWGLTPTVYTSRFIDALASTGEKIEVHLKIDTGMHRVGAAPDDVEDLAGKVAASSNLMLGAAWTHFAVADEDIEFTRRQTQTFMEAVDGLDAPMVHLANTAGAVLFPEARGDMCRIGLGLYGLHPCPETTSLLDLRPAMSVVSSVTHVRRLEAGVRPSYGRVRPLTREAAVATVPIGYADGIPRRRLGDVLIGGHRHPLAGRVTMDQLMVDVGDARVSIGDEVVLMGAQGEETIGADEWAEEIGTISYEILCDIGPRVPRRYTQ